MMREREKEKERFLTEKGGNAHGGSLCKPPPGLQPGTFRGNINVLSGIIANLMNRSPTLEERESDNDNEDDNDKRSSFALESSSPYISSYVRREARRRTARPVSSRRSARLPGVSARTWEKELLSKKFYTPYSGTCMCVRAWV